MKSDYEPTELDFLAAELTGFGKTSHEGRELQTSVRLPYHVGLQVSALSLNSGLSKNKIFAALMSVGLEELRGKLDADERERLFNCAEVLKQWEEQAQVPADA